MASNKDKTYKIKIGRESYEVEFCKITGAEILQLAKKDGEQFIIYQKLKGGKRSIVALDDVVDLSEPGREKFVIIPCDQTEGYVGTTEFELPASDVEYLCSLGNRWKTIVENNIRRVLIYDYRIPDGYTETAVNINLRIGANYPDEQIDMVYIYPPLLRTDGEVIAALATDKFDGKEWQRWSRHRTPQNPWIPGEDDISTHLVCVDQWLTRELNK